MRNLTTNKIFMQAQQMSLQVLQRFALSQIVRKFVEMAQPDISVLPVGESQGRENVGAKAAVDCLA